MVATVRENSCHFFLYIYCSMEETVKIKSLDYYNQNKQIFNRNYNSITKKYVSRNRIGSCSYLFLKYQPTSYQDFADKYFADYDDSSFNNETCVGDKHRGRSLEQMNKIAHMYYAEINDPEITTVQCFDDLINHVIIETFDGHQAELYLCNIVNKHGEYEINTGVDDLDTVCGVDLIIHKRGTNHTRYIQVKPNTTFMGNKNISLRADRVNFFEKEKKLQNYLKDNNVHIEYMIYYKDEYDFKKKFKFLKINGKFRHRLEDLCNPDGTMKIFLRYSYFEQIK